MARALSKQGPRRVRTKRWVWYERIGILICTVLYVFIVSGRAAEDIDELKLLEREGKRVYATVTRARSSKSSIYVAYRYHYGGNTFDGEDALSVEELLKYGKSIPITIAPHEPRIHRVGSITSPDVDDAPWRWGLAIVVPACVAFIYQIVLELRHRLQKQALRSFDLVRGTVTKIEPASAFLDSKLALRFRYRDAQDNTFAGSSTLSRSACVGLHEKGRIELLVDPEDANSAIPLIAIKLVELEK